MLEFVESTVSNTLKKRVRHAANGLYFFFLFFFCSFFSLLFYFSSAVSESSGFAIDTPHETEKARMIGAVLYWWKPRLRCYTMEGLGQTYFFFLFVLILKWRFWGTTRSCWQARIHQRATRRTISRYGRITLFPLIGQQSQQADYVRGEIWSIVLLLKRSMAQSKQNIPAQQSYFSLSLVAGGFRRLWGVFSLLAAIGWWILKSENSSQVSVLLDGFICKVTQFLFLAMDQIRCPQLVAPVIRRLTIIETDLNQARKIKLN